MEKLSDHVFLRSDDRVVRFSSVSQVKYIRYKAALDSLQLFFPKLINVASFKITSSPRRPRFITSKYIEGQDIDFVLDRWTDHSEAALELDLELIRYYHHCYTTGAEAIWDLHARQFRWVDGIGFVLVDLDLFLIRFKREQEVFQAQESLDVQSFVLPLEAHLFTLVEEYFTILHHLPEEMQVHWEKALDNLLLELRLVYPMPIGSFVQSFYDQFKSFE
jgi:hypothetical protein